MNLFRSNGGLPGGKTSFRPAAAVAPALIFLLLLLTSCGGSSGTGTSGGADLRPQGLWPVGDGGTLTTTREGCELLTGPTLPGGDFIFALTDSVLPSHAPVPRNGAERVVFAQLYETLVQVDCTGEIRPGLAESWAGLEGSTVWVFTIREGARFWDGSPITAHEVSRTLMNFLAQTVTVLDDRRVSIRTSEPQPRLPVLLAHPALAIAAVRPGWTWPVGSGPCRLRASDPEPLPDLVCLANVNHPARPGWKSLTFRVLPGTDPRDLLVTDMDLTLVRDMDVVRFFDDAPGFSTVPLPWNRLYLLVCPPDMNPHGADRWIQAATRMDVGRDVTAISALPWPEVLFPAGGKDRCPRVKGRIPGLQSARLDWNLAEKKLDQDVLVYPRGDSGAREMAHRIGALAGNPARTAALPDEGVAFALQWQMAGAFILPWDQQYPSGCLQIGALLNQADWLPDSGLDLVHPLGLGRSWLIVHGSPAGVELAFDGTPLLAGLGASLEGAPDEATP